MQIGPDQEFVADVEGCAIKRCGGAACTGNQKLELKTAEGRHAHDKRQPTSAGQPRRASHGEEGSCSLWDSGTELESGTWNEAPAHEWLV